MTLYQDKSGNGEDKEKKKQFAYTTYDVTVPSHIVHFYVSSDIKDPDHYVDMVYRLQTANEQDVFYVHLNTIGGRLDSGVQIINAMRACNGHVVTSLESQCHSMGALIFLSGDQFMIHDNCMMMFHNYSGGVFGKGHEQRAQLEAEIKWFNKLMKQICYPFLTMEEIEKILKGEDLWVDSEQIRKRLEKAMKQIETERVAKTRKKKPVEPTIPPPASTTVTTVTEA
jgi:ATP-dependent protease ClpP protease subunit